MPLTAAAEDSGAIASIQKLQVTFETRDGVVTGVEDVSFDIQAGETVCVVGESGSGKSVSSLSLMRLVEYGGGEIARGRLLFNRRNGDQLDLAQTNQSAMRDIRGNEIGMIFQEPMTALNPVFTIGRQLTEGLRAHLGLSKRAAEKRALGLLKELRIPEPERRLRQYPHELSGGMRQRVVIAADRVVVMFRGNKVEEGPVEQIFTSPQHPYTRALLAAVPRLGDMHGTNLPEPMKLFGRTDQVIQSIAGTDEPLLTVNNLTTRFPVKGGFFRRTVANVHAVEDVSFQINKGQTLSLVGESGCGKSSVGRSLLRLVEPLSGSVELGGKDILSLSGKELRDTRRDMQMIFQDPFASLNPQIKLADQVAEPLINYGAGRTDDIMDTVAGLFDRVELPRSYMNRFPHELSGGQRQRIAIARALATLAGSSR